MSQDDDSISHWAGEEKNEWDWDTDRDDALLTATYGRNEKRLISVFYPKIVGVDSVSDYLRYAYTQSYTDVYREYLPYSVAEELIPMLNNCPKLEYKLPDKESFDGRLMDVSVDGSGNISSRFPEMQLNKLIGLKEVLVPQNSVCLRIVIYRQLLKDYRNGEFEQVKPKYRHFIEEKEEQYEASSNRVAEEVQSIIEDIFFRDRKKVKEFYQYDTNSMIIFPEETLRLMFVEEKFSVWREALGKEKHEEIAEFIQEIDPLSYDEKNMDQRLQNEGYVAQPDVEQEEI